MRIIIILVILISGCTAKHLPRDTSIVDWKGKKMLVKITDPTGKEKYQPVYLK